jgi:DNA modification methylase
VTWEIRQGDALERLREMPDESVQCCVTSPPYWGLRDYGVAGQMGMESTPEEFVASMVAVFGEVRRVLRDDGTLWLNIGDSYAGSLSRTPRLKAKDLVGVPWTLALALRADGWYLRRDIIWSKPNPMPESVTDRPTSAHEYIFLLSKSPRYFYDAEAIREPSLSPYSLKRPDGWATEGRHEAVDHSRRTRDKQRGHGRRHDGFNDRWDSMSKEEQQALGRNKRSVWTIATRPYPEAHFATFPPDLVQPCILAGTPPKVCGECQAPWCRVTESEFVPQPDVANSQALRRDRNGLDDTSGWGDTPRGTTVRRTLGWESQCEHHDSFGIAVALDPFAGAATTGLVATRLGRDFIGIELSPEYVELGRRRIQDDAPLLNTPAEAAA